MSHNAALLLCAPLPAIIFSAYCRRQGCVLGTQHQGWRNRVLFEMSCYNWHLHPVVTVNQLLLWNLCLLFWLASLVQRSTWVRLTASSHQNAVVLQQADMSDLQLIDPYWTVIPILIEAYYALHPSASYSARSNTAFALIIVWSLRLTHSYFRR